VRVKNEDKVKLHYTYSVEGGREEVDLSTGKESIEFEVGNGAVIQGVEEAVIGMEQGEKKKITVSPEKAFGERKTELVQKAPINVLAGKSVSEGEFLEVSKGEDRLVKAQVKSFDEDSVILDLNHPLAGKTIEFEIEVADIKR